MVEVESEGRELRERTPTSFDAELQATSDESSSQICPLNIRVSCSRVSHSFPIFAQINSTTPT